MPHARHGHDRWRAIYERGRAGEINPEAARTEYVQLYAGGLRALGYEYVQERPIGDSGTIEEIVEKVCEMGGFTAEQQAVRHGDGPAGEIAYCLAWARAYLKGVGTLDNGKRGFGARRSSDAC